MTTYRNATGEGRREDSRSDLDKKKLSIDRLRMHELISYHIPDAVRVQVIKVSALYFCHTCHRQNSPNPFIFHSLPHYLPSKTYQRICGLMNSIMKNYFSSLASQLESHSGYAEDDSSIDVRRFSVDPLITNFAGFQTAIVNAFNLKRSVTKFRLFHIPSFIQKQ